MQLPLRASRDVFHEVDLGQLLGNGSLRADLKRHEDAGEPEIFQFRHH